jgi:hypothetical protein
MFIIQILISHSILTDDINGDYKLFGIPPAWGRELSFLHNVRLALGSTKPPAQ